MSVMGPADFIGEQEKKKKSWHCAQETCENPKQIKSVNINVTTDHPVVFSTYMALNLIAL